MTRRALVIGEALIDIVERDGRVLGEHVGGSPLNVAVGLGRLGRGVDFLTHIGDDERGRRIVDYVEASGVRLVPGSTTAERTPTALARLDETGAADYVFDIDVGTGGHAGGGAAGRRAHRVDRRLPRPGLPGDGRAARRVPPVGHHHVRPERAAGADHRSRAGHRTHRPPGRTRRRRQGQRRGPAVDRPGLALPSGSPTTWLASGPSIVAVTMGERGAFAVCAAGTVRVAARQVDVVDTVGAGDAFMTGPDRRAVVAGPAGRRPSRRPGAHRHRHPRGSRARRVAGVGADRRQGRAPTCRIAQLSNRADVVRHTGLCVRSGRVPSPSAW